MRCVVKDAELVDIHIGVCADGLHVYHNGLHINRFPWPKITKMSYKKNVFYVNIRPGAVSDFVCLMMKDDICANTVIAMMVKEI